MASGPCSTYPSEPCSTYPSVRPTATLTRRPTAIHSDRPTARQAVGLQLDKRTVYGFPTLTESFLWNILQSFRLTDSQQEKVHSSFSYPSGFLQVPTNGRSAFRDDLSIRNRKGNNSAEKLNLLSMCNRKISLILCKNTTRNWTYTPLENISA